MTATFKGTEEIRRHSFEVEVDGLKYHVTCMCNASDKILDETIQHHGIELDREGGEGDLREQILDFVVEEWETLVK